MARRATLSLMTGDAGWLSRMTAEDRDRFTTATAQFLALQEEIRSVSGVAVLEHSLVDDADLSQARDYWRSIAAHYARLAELHRGVAQATATMAEITDRYVP